MWQGAGAGRWETLRKPVQVPWKDLGADSFFLVMAICNPSPCSQGSQGRLNVCDTQLLVDILLWASAVVCW